MAQPTGPEVLAMFQQYMANMSAGPDMSLQQSDLPIRFLPSTDEDNEFGSQDYLNDNLTAEKKVNDVLSDPAFLSRLGAGTGGFRPQDFQPKVTYQPVKAPGYQRLAMYEGSNDPVQIIMADVFRNKGTAKEAESAVLSAMMNKDHPFYDQLNADEAIHYTDQGARTVDRKYIRQLAGSIEKDVISDPQFSTLDRGMPADAMDENGNVISDPAGGGAGFDTSGAGFTDGEMTTGIEGGGKYDQGQDDNWYLRQETPTDTMAYFDEQGLYNPYDTYNPDDLASGGDLSHRDSAFQRYVGAQDTFDTKTAGLSTAADRGSIEALVRNQLLGQHITNKQTAAAAGPVGPVPPAAAAPRTNESVWGARAGAAPDAPGLMGAARNSSFTNNMERDTKRGANTKLQKDSMIRYLADIDRKREQSGAYWAEQGNRKRQGQAQRLHAQGFSPFADQMRAREANVYGF